jgi:fatty acid/phospholipid biosynthesis enzyme
MLSIAETPAACLGAMFTVKAIPGVIRPCITGILPKAVITVILDVGTIPIAS